MIPEHLNPLSSSIYIYPDLTMNNPGYFNLENFISLNLKICFLIKVKILARPRLRLDVSLILFEEDVTKRGSVFLVGLASP